MTETELRAVVREVREALADDRLWPQGKLERIDRAVAHAV